jgi:hypothetical protein
MEIIDPHAAADNVTNGRVYEKTSWKEQGIRTLTVPKGTRVEHGKTIEIFTEKSLHFLGHPPLPMHISKAKEYMGVAGRSEASSLTLATFGEWDSKEGGASLRMVVRAPEGVRVKFDSNLSGPRSQAQGKAAEKKGFYWYGPTSPADGWELISFVSDPKMTAQS